MEKRILKKEKRLCVCCMTEHEVITVAMEDHMIFKDMEVSFIGIYDYCEKADEFFTDEEQTNSNNRKMKDAYRKKKGLLTSDEIKSIRKKSGLSPEELSDLLGWGDNRIAEYESYRVQDETEDAILREIGEREAV